MTHHLWDPPATPLNQQADSSHGAPRHHAAHRNPGMPRHSRGRHSHASAHPDRRHQSTLQAPPADTRRRTRSRTGFLVASGLAAAVVSAGVGAAVASTVDHADLSPSTAVTAAAGQPMVNRGPGSVEQVAAKVVPSVVELGTGAGGQATEGSGVILTSDGLILTNSHVVSPSADGAPVGGETRVTFSDGRTVPFRIVGTDPASDIAVVRALGVSGLTPVTLGSSASLRVGNGVVAVGSPLGLENTVTSGIISALNRPISATTGDGNPNTEQLNTIQTDAAMNPGSSGGALADMSGRLIGINSAIASLGGDAADPQSGSIGLGFAIPVDQVKSIADRLIATGKA
jgi:putative serine protease PepD